MRTSLDELTWHAMDAMADDWESLEQIVPHVEHFLGATDKAGIAKLLVVLVSEGLLREMERITYQQLTADMVLETPIEYWFAMTPQGRALWDSEGPKYRNDNAR